MPATRLPQTARSAADVLAAARELVDPAVRAAVGTLPEPLRLLSGYHFGWWDEHGVPTCGNGGKSLRSAFVLLSAEALGGAPEDAVPAAVAVDLVHNHSLLHDDVIDRDPTRRHRPTVWSRFGIGPAILAGDALLALAFDLPTAPPALATATQGLLHGQCDDIAFEQRSDVTLAECVAMARRKTAMLFACACTLGAQSAQASRARTDRLREFGHHVGLAFQLVDDVLGIWGDPAETGKPVHSDLRARKKSLPVLAAMRSGTAAGRLLVARYADPEADAAELADLVDRAGGRDWAQGQAHRESRLALRQLWLAEPRPEPAAGLVGLTQLITGRQS
ncbi:MAG: polyprenyl synthetase family protein [Thermocrispum sp.]